MFEGLSKKDVESESPERMGIAHRIRSEILERLKTLNHKEPTKSTDSDSEQTIQEPTETAIAEIENDQDLVDA